MISVCDNNYGQIMVVQFIATPGNVPKIKADVSQLIWMFGAGLKG